MSSKKPNTTPPPPLLPLCFSASTTMEKHPPPFFLSFLVPFPAPKLLSSQPSSSCITELTLSLSLSPTPTETQIYTASTKRKQPSFESEPQETAGKSQPSSSCSTGLALSLSLSPTPTETQISTASMKRKQPSSESEFSSTARKRACGVVSEKCTNSQKNWGYSLALMLYDDPWKIKKILTQSDVDESSRLLMAKDLVGELVLPVFDSGSQRGVAKNGSPVVFWDVNDESEHQLIIKLWPSTKCYVFVDGWKRNFVDRRKLKKGDEIGLHWDPYKGRFDFTVFSKAVRAL